MGHRRCSPANGWPRARRRTSFPMLRGQPYTQPCSEPCRNERPVERVHRGLCTNKRFVIRLPSRQIAHTCGRARSPLVPYRKLAAEILAHWREIERAMQEPGVTPEARAGGWMAQ